jgi:hypothetical protein
MDEFTVSSVDGTNAVIPITINPLVGGNLAGQFDGNTGADARWSIDIRDLTGVQGKASVLMLYPEGSTRDARLVFSGRQWRGTQLLRVYAALTVRANGELRLSNEIRNGFHTLDQTIVQGTPFLVELTWDSSAGTPALISLAIDGTPISSDAISFNTDNTFASLTVGAGLQNEGPGFFDVHTRDGSPVIIDDFKLYSDVAGTVEVYSEDFETADDNNILEATTFIHERLFRSGGNGSTGNSEATAVPLTKP